MSLRRLRFSMVEMICFSCFLGGCTFSPKIPDGTVRCQTHSDCPNGFSCVKNTDSQGVEGVCCNNGRCNDRTSANIDANGFSPWGTRTGGTSSGSKTSDVGEGASTTGGLNKGNPIFTGGFPADGGTAENGSEGTDTLGGKVTVGGMVSTSLPNSGGAPPLPPLNGGRSAAGGSMPSLGGGLGTGGRLGLGGAMATGGTPFMGGAISNGGSATRGGTPALGGRISSGGETAIGGALTLGGALGVGGVPAIDAGIILQGGAINLGGMLSTGGSGGSAGAGGMLGSGGNLGAGGITVPEPETGILNFNVSPGTVTLGKPATLKWKVKGARTLTIDQGIGSVLGLDSYVVLPLVTTTYTLWLNGTDSDQVTVVVNSLPILSPTE